MELKETTFAQVRLGGVFFDPSTGQKYQKVDSLTDGGDNKHGEEYNAWGERGQKNFSHNDEARAHKSRIMNFKD